MSTVTGKPLLITVAPNGARREKSEHAGVPIAAREIGFTAAACRDAGAGMIHVHVRDELGAHSLAPNLYRQALREIQHLAGTDLLVQVTTESGGVYDVAQQMAAVRGLNIEAASFALSEFFPGETVDATVTEFFVWTIARGVGCQFELYAPSEVSFLKSVVARGYLKLARPHALFVLGRTGRSEAAGLAQLEAFLAEWPANWPWSVCVFGRAELKIAERAIALGGHVRVGFENNLFESDGQPLASNEARVAQVAALAASAGRPLVTPAQARDLFRLKE
jgi:uncharacterized protein (DUF849 family)